MTGWNLFVHQQMAMSKDNIALEEATPKLKAAWSDLSPEQKETYNGVGKVGVIMLLNCDNCGKQFKKQKRLNEHKKTCGGVKCEICEKTLSSEKSLQEHINSRHSTNFRCAHCLKCFGGLGKLKQHMAVHDESKRLQCEKCSKNFARKDNLKRHMKTHS